MSKVSKLCKRHDCRKRFVPRRPDQLYCSTSCRPSATFAGSGLNLATGTVGAIAELAVSQDLMRRGFEVYRALSMSSSCDLLILKDNKVITIEVRSAVQNCNGTLSVPMRNFKAQIMAKFVHRTNSVVYDPPLG